MDKTTAVEFTKLKLWLDCEITLLHIALVLIGALVFNNMTGYIIAGIYILLSLKYFIKRSYALAMLDPHYLDVPVVKTASKSNKQ